VTPELIGITGLFGSIVAMGAVLFAVLKLSIDNVNKRFDDVDKRFDDVNKRFDNIDNRFERIEDDISKLKEGQARLEGMFEGAFERRLRTPPEEPVAADPGGGRRTT
jgi:hypothetical protein